MQPIKENAKQCGTKRATLPDFVDFVDFAGGNPRQSDTKYYLQEQNAGGPLA